MNELLFIVPVLPPGTVLSPVLLTGTGATRLGIQGHDASDSSFGNRRLYSARCTVTLGESGLSIPQTCTAAKDAYRADNRVRPGPEQLERDSTRLNRLPLTGQLSTSYPVRRPGPRSGAQPQPVRSGGKAGGWTPALRFASAGVTVLDLARNAVQSERIPL